MTDSNEQKAENKTCTRRRLLTGAAAALAAATVADESFGAATAPLRPASPYGQAAEPIEPDSRVVHSVCLGCNARCGNRQIVKKGRLEKISGNPYHPYNSLGAPIPYDTPVNTSLGLPSPVCGKAHDAFGYVYNERRLVRPLKRAGARGEGRFQEISWEQLIQEIGKGGTLFSDLGEDREVPGLSACLSDDPIDPADSSLGSKRNGFTMITGRLQSGRKEFIDRFVKSSVGSINRIGHTDICGLGFRMGNYAMTEGKEVELKADPWSAEYILVFGANIYEALQPGINTYGAAVAKRSGKNEVRFTIVDPRAQNSSVHAHDWLPIIPGQDGALAMAMIRWIIENERYNREFLELPNQTAAQAEGYMGYANATHLVIDTAGHPNQGKFLRAADLKTAPTDEDKATFMILDEHSTPIAFTSATSAPLEAELELTTENGEKIRVVTAFTLMKKAAFAHSLAEYSAWCGIPEAQIMQTAQDFTSHGSKAAVCQYHGAGNYSNGTHAAFAIALLNVLIGSTGMKGGYLNGGGGLGSWKKGSYDLAGFSGKQKPGGVKISREGGKYEKTTEFAAKKESSGSGYPARRPWYSFTKGGLSVESMSGIDESYPYQCQVLFTYFYNPVYSTPGGYRFVETLADPAKVPLHVSIDIGVNESNLYADYIVPDVTYLEGQYGWLTPHAPAMKFTGVRVPCLEPVTGMTGDGRPFCLETFLIDLAVSLSLPGFGEQGISEDNSKVHPLNRAEDFYLRAYANIAAGAKLPEASTEEVHFVERNYPLAAFKDMLPAPQWRQVCYMLARGGVFSDYEAGFTGDTFKHGLERYVLYNEKLATTRNSLTGQLFSGTIEYLPPTESGGLVVAEVDSAFPLTVVTHKMHVHTQSRTTWHRVAMELFPENRIQLNPLDARDGDVRTGDRVRLISASNPDGVIGTVEVTQLIRPGCAGISFHYGHSQLGASPISATGAANIFLGGEKVCDEDTLKAEATLGAGTNPNMVGRLDGNLANTPLVDVLAGIPDFSSTRVRLEKIS